MMKEVLAKIMWAKKKSFSLACVDRVVTAFSVLLSLSLRSPPFLSI